MFAFNNRPAFVAVAVSALLLAAPSFAQTMSTQPPAAGTSESMPNPAPNAPSQYPPAASTGSSSQAGTSSAKHTQSAATHRADNVEARIKHMHDQLKITSDQESDWNEVAAAMRDNSQSIQPLIQQRDQNYRHMSAVDNLKSYQEITTAHAEGLKKLETAFSKLYGDMTDAQKKNADHVFSNIAARHEKTHKPAATAPKTNG